MATNQAHVEISATDKTRAAFESVNQSLSKIKTAAFSLNSVLSGIGVGISVSAFAGFTKSALDYADSIEDIASANDVAIATILELNQALLVSGGNSDTAAGMLAKFAQYIEKAVGGSDDARKNLNKLGISLKDLETLSQEDLFNKTIEGMSGLGSSTEKTALKLEIFGKSTKKLDINALSDELKKNKGSQDANADSVKRAAEIVDRWSLAWARAKVSFIVAIDEMAKKNDQFQSLGDTQKNKGFEFGGIADLVKNQKQNAELLRKKREADIEAKLAEKAVEKEVKRKLDSSESAAKATKEVENYLDKLKKQTVTLGESKSATLQYEASQLKLSKTQKDQVNVLLSQIKSQEDLAETQKRLSASYGDLTAIFTLNSIEKSNIEILQTKLDLMQELPEAARIMAQAELDLAKSIELTNAQQAAQNANIDFEIDQFNELYEAEKQSAEERQKLFAETSERLKRENEDLNINLLSSDKARAKAQADLEHERSVDRINAMMLEGEEAQELIEQETKNYELRLKQIEKTNSAARDLGLTFSSAFEDAVISGKKFKDVLASLAQDIEKILLRRTVTEPLMGAFDTLLGSFDFGNFFQMNANGNAYQSADLSQYSGSVVNKPTMFAFAKGAGIMGEAGVEGIFPLKRGKDGKLGVSAEGSTGTNVTVNLIESPGNGGQVNQTQNGNNLTLDIMVEKIESIIGRNISQGRGIAPTMERQYGLNRAAGAY